MIFEVKVLLYKTDVSENLLIKKHVRQTENYFQTKQLNPNIYNWQGDAPIKEVMFYLQTRLELC